MRRELLRLGMSQLSAGSKTDVGAYHRDDSQATQENLSDLNGQFTLADHRPGGCASCAALGSWPAWCVGLGWWAASPAVATTNCSLITAACLCACPPHRPLPPAVQDIVMDLMKEGYVPSWCTACYRKGKQPGPRCGAVNCAASECQSPSLSSLPLLEPHSRPPLLRRRPHRGALYADCQGRQHPQLLPPQQPLHAAGVPGERGLSEWCFALGGRQCQCQFSGKR
jgi:hypothetical protein